MNIKHQKLLSWLLSAAMALSLFPSAALAAEVDGENQDNNVVVQETDDQQTGINTPSNIAVQTASNFAGGSGTEDAPYLIANATQMDSVRNDLTAHYRLTSDIDLTGISWEPIGAYVMENGEDANKAAAFTGAFDGGGHTISNITVDTSNSDNDNTMKNYAKYGTFGTGGVFNCVSGSGAEIKDLTVSGVDIKGYALVGGVVGYADDSATITNVKSVGTAENNNKVESTAMMAGGVIGGCMGITLDGCEAFYVTSVAGQCGNSGALGGGLSHSTVKDCTVNNCTVNATKGGAWIGRLSGCMNYGDALASDHEFKSCTVSNTTINVGVTASYIGGLTGAGGNTLTTAAQTRAVIDTCKVENVDIVISDGATVSNVGGLIGGGLRDGDVAPNSFAVKNCTVDAESSITGATNCAANGIGTLIGEAYYCQIVKGGENIAISDAATDLSGTGTSSALAGLSNGTTIGKVLAASGELFDSGSGTAENPYVITTAAQLSNVHNYLSASFKLGKDIDLSNYEGWEPIGVLRYDTDVNMTTGKMDTTKAFSGVFDGNGKTISNVTVDASTDAALMSPGGIFSCVTGTVKGLTVKNVTVTANKDAAMTTGGVVGYAMGGSTLSNVDLTTDEGKRNTVTGRNCIGGVAGGFEGTASSCNVSKTDIVVLGSNDFSKTPGRIIQCDIAECGGPVIGGGFGGSSVTGCSATDCTVTAEGDEPIGLGGLAGCLQCIPAISNNTVSNVTITTMKGGHAIGGLVGYAGTGDDGKGTVSAPAKITGNSVNITINAPGATHVGGLIGTGLYYMGMEDRFTTSGNTVTGAITAGTDEGTIYGLSSPGAIAGRAVGCTIGETGFTGLIFNGTGTASPVGTTGCLYESGDQYQDYSSVQLHTMNGTYQPLFHGATFETKCNSYWHDAAAAVVGASSADAAVAMLKQSVGAETQAAAIASQADSDQTNNQFFCGFTGDFTKFEINNDTITCYKGKTPYAATYKYAGVDGLYMGSTEVMSGFTLVEKVSGSDEAPKYFYMAPDTMDHTYHIEFRYGNNLDDLKQYATGNCAYWLAAGIDISAMNESSATSKGTNDATLKQVIALFCEENLASNEDGTAKARTNESLAQLSDLVGIWDADAATIAILEKGMGISNVRMYCQLNADGTGATYVDMGTGSYVKSSSYTFYAYDNDSTAQSGVYLVNNSGSVASSPYDIVNGKISFYAADGTATYVKRTSNSGGTSGSGGTGSSGGDSSNSDSTTVTVSGGSVTAAQVENAVKSAKAGMSISISAANNATVSLPVSGLKAAVSNGNSLNVTEKNGSVTLSAAALAGVVGGASSGATVSVGITSTTASTAGLPDGTPVFDVALAVNGSAIHSFGGELTITLTVSNLSNIENPYVLHILTDGTKQYLKPTVSGSKLTVNGVKNLSYFAVIPGSEVPASLGFTDVATGTYYYDAVAWAVKKGVTGGIAATTFAPNATCTRAQIVTFLWRANGSPEPTVTANPFTDVSADAYYYKAVLWAVEKGITGGTYATTFSPYAACTRAQIVTFLYRMSGSPSEEASSAFSDMATNAYYASAVNWAVVKGITSGTSATTFAPGAICTRAQSVTFLYRSLNK